MFLHDRAPKRFRILRDLRLEPGDRGGRIEKRAADVNLARVNLHVKSQRMAELIEAARPAPDAFIDRFAHRANFAVQEIDVMAANFEPSAAIHTRSPFAKRSDQLRYMPIVQLLRGRSQSHRRERTRRVVVDSKIDIRAIVGGATRARSTEHNRDDAVDLRNARDN